mmetsp:Transcript_8800/g.29367  ORF Transcript_8800/g.29367 Transcript_8800/m.29367 type:complete len:134 (+) Transcript_8800:67-468(+)
MKSMARWWGVGGKERGRRKEAMAEQDSHHANYHPPSSALRSSSSSLHVHSASHGPAQLAGVGLVIGKRKQGYLVKDILQGTGAMLSGMRRGDLIVQVRISTTWCHRHLLAQVCVDSLAGQREGRGSFEPGGSD